MTAKGLTCRATANQPEGPLSLSKFAKLLRRRYYLGVVTYRGMEYEGRHDRLVDPDTFERVQELMDSRIKAGEKQRLHQHYLKGTLYCRRCQTRLGLIYANGHGGVYPYFYCLGRQRRNGCDLPYLALDPIEERVERLYREIQLTDEEASALRAELVSRVGGGSQAQWSGDQDLGETDRQTRSSALPMVGFPRETGQPSRSFLVGPELLELHR